MRALRILFTFAIALTLAIDAFGARRKGKGKGRGRIVAAAHNPNFMTSCSKSVPSVYNPRINNSMQGGKSNRMGERVTSVEEAARTGKPVTVSMDMYGDFGAQCNYKKGKSNRRCMLLIHLPGLDKVFPDYGKKFKNLPKDSILAIVEDTGGAFYNRGTGKVDIPFDNTGTYFSKSNPRKKVSSLHSANEFKNASFEVLEKYKASGNAMRRSRTDFPQAQVFDGSSPHCNWQAQRSGQPLSTASVDSEEGAPFRELSDFFQNAVKGQR